MNIDNGPRPERPRTSTDERCVKLVADALEEDRRATCEELFRATGAKLRRKMHKNRLQLPVAGSLILHGNARPHIAVAVTKNLRDCGWEVLPHASKSADMNPPDFDLFPKLKEPMRGRRFSPLEELSTDGTRAIRYMNERGVLDGIIMFPNNVGTQ